MARVFMLLSVIFVSVYVTEQAYFLQKDYIDNINEQATTWKAGVNFHPNTPEDHFVKLLGSKGVQNPHKNNINLYKTNDVAYENVLGRVPKHFDARKKWRNCHTIGAVRDQGYCGSCWAVVTSSAFADRLCIATNGDFNELLSAEEITFCCQTCGNGCYGGYPIKAWKRFSDKGLASGGDYKSRMGCEPYDVPPCPYDDEGNMTCAGKPMEVNHECRKICYGNESLNFEADHRYTRDYYHLSYSIIQLDVMTHGPVEASFDVYSDFPSYKSGVYEKSDNVTYLGGHSVKLIGWGEEDGIPYWLIMNTWNVTWGDHGLFKIKRGTNECRIESSATGGVPLTE